MGTNQHVIKRDHGWAVESEKRPKQCAYYPTQKEAIDAARKIAQEQRSEVIIHDQHGRIREKDSYGNDSYPPKG